jgi:hypothetical protein
LISQAIGANNTNDTTPAIPRPATVRRHGASFAAIAIAAITATDTKMNLPVK